MPSNIKHSDRAHALLSPSSSKRWINCTPSAMLEDAEPDHTSDAAREGTTAHEVAELTVRAMLRQIDGSEWAEQLSRIRANANKNLFDEAMTEHASNYWDEISIRINDFLEVDDPESLKTAKVEAKVYMEEVTGEAGQSGHVDFMAWHNTRLLTIDYKYGQGVRVDAKGNPQLRIYALGMVLGNPGKFTEVQTVIYQPRLGHLSIETISVKALLDWHKTVVKPAAKMALKGEGKQAAGPWCKFCKIEGKCSTLAGFSTKDAVREFNNIHELSLQHQKEVFEKWDIVKSFFTALEKHMLSQALQGIKYPGLRLVEAQTKRTWTDPDVVQSILEMNGYEEDEIVKKSLKPIGDIEKLVGKKIFANDFYMLTDRPKGGPVLAKADDKRRDFNDIQDEFKEFNDDEDEGGEFNELFS